MAANVPATTRIGAFFAGFNASGFPTGSKAAHIQAQHQRANEQHATGVWVSPELQAPSFRQVVVHRHPFASATWPNSAFNRSRYRPRPLPPWASGPVNSALGQNTLNPGEAHSGYRRQHPHDPIHDHRGEINLLDGCGIKLDGVSYVLLRYKFNNPLAHACFLNRPAAQGLKHTALKPGTASAFLCSTTALHGTKPNWRFEATASPRLNLIVRRHPLLNGQGHALQRFCVGIQPVRLRVASIASHSARRLQQAKINEPLDGFAPYGRRVEHQRMVATRRRVVQQDVNFKWRHALFLCLPAWVTGSTVTPNPALNRSALRLRLRSPG